MFLWLLLVDPRIKNILLLVSFQTYTNIFVVWNGDKILNSILHHCSLIVNLIIAYISNNK